MYTTQTDSASVQGFPLQVSGPLNAGAPLNAVFIYLVLNPLMMILEQVVLLSNIDPSVGDLEQLTYFSFVHFRQKCGWLIFLIF